MVWKGILNKGIVYVDCDKMSFSSNDENSGIFSERYNMRISSGYDLDLGQNY